MELKCVLDRPYQDCADEMETAMSYRESGDLEYAHFFEGRADGLRQATLLLEILTDKKKSSDACEHRCHPRKKDSKNIIPKRPWFVKCFAGLTRRPYEAKGGSL